MLQKHFETLTDVRVQGRTKHNLLEIVLITICAVMTGIDAWWQIADFARVKAQWFREKLGLELKRGVPSHDTFQRVFELIDPKEFERCFVEWVRAAVKSTEGEIVSIDGKTLRGSRRAMQPPLHLVSAWAKKSKLVLGQIRTKDKSNEITAIPELLKLLELKGCIVTIDAMGTQVEIADKIVKQGNDYVLAVKGNQPNLHKDIWMYFDECLCNESQYFEGNRLKTSEKGHGRIEKRKYYLETDIAWLTQKTEWSGIKAIGMVECETDRNGKITTERRHYITTLTEAEKFAEAVRAHWGVENSLHWCMDVTFREDASTISVNHAAENFAVVRRIALNLTKHYDTGAKEKMSVRAKLKKCEYDADFMSDVLLTCLLDQPKTFDA